MITLTQVIKKHRIKLGKGHKNAIGLALKAKSVVDGLLPMYVPERDYQVNAYPDDYEQSVLDLIKEQVPLLKDKDKLKQARREEHEGFIKRKAEAQKLAQAQEEAKKEPVYKKVVVGKKPRPRIKK